MATGHRAAIFSLVFAIFVNALGMAILFPLLNPLFIDPQSSILPQNMSVDTRYILYGVALGIFSLAMFFAAPILGDLSDHIGRKKVLLISLIGTFISYLLMALSVPLRSISLFLLGRLVGGLTAGSQSTAQAAVIDISHPEHKAHNLSLIIAGVSFGWVAGPLLGGLISDPSLVSWFSPTLSLFFAAVLAFLNVVVLQCCFKETLKEKKLLEKLHLHKGPIEFFLAFSKKNLRPLSIIYLIQQLGMAFYFSYVSLFLASYAHFSTYLVALFLTFLAIGISIPSLGLLKKANQYLTLKNAAGIALVVTGIASLLTTIVTSHTILLWATAIVVGLGMGASISYILTLFSNSVRVEEQGRIMGITTSIASVSWTLSALLGGLLVNITISFPLILGGILFLLASFLTYKKS